MGVIQTEAGPFEIKGDEPNPTELQAIAGLIQSQRQQKPAPDLGPAIAAAGGEGKGESIGRWLTTRVEKAATNLAASGRSIADINEQTARWLAKQAGASEKWQNYLGVAASLISPVPGGRFLPTGEQSREAIDTVTGFREQNAPKEWGILGRVLDTGTEAALSSLVAPAGGVQSIVRNIVPSAVGGAASEATGEALKGTPYEIPGRILSGVLAGTATGVAQNVSGNVARGVRNIGQSDVGAKEQAQRILARAVERDKMTFPELAAQHGEYLPGTPLVATAGPNVVGATRGAFTAPGPGREVIDTGTKQFFAGADDRVGGVIDRISTGPSVPTRVDQLEKEAAKAGPLYKQAGVPDDPQAILLSKPGGSVPTKSTILGPDGQPIVTMKPGPSVTSTVSNGLIVKSPELQTFLDDSGYAKQAINKARKLSGFADVPTNDMAMVDKIYKHLGGLEAQAVRSGNGQVARELGNERRKLLEILDKENPAYSKALRAYGEPMSLANAAQKGEAMAKRNISPDEMQLVYQGLPDEAHRAEFRGGYASALRGQSDATNRASAAERIWNSNQASEKVNRMVTPTEQGPSNVFQTIDRDLENEKSAARALREVTKGSPTGRILSELADNAGVDVGTLVQDLSNKGILGTILAKALEAGGGFQRRVSEGRTATVNRELAQLAMETNPAEIQRNAHMIERARAAAARTAAARQAVPLVGGGVGAATGGSSTGLLAPPDNGPVDRLWQGIMAP